MIDPDYPRPETGGVYVRDPETGALKPSSPDDHQSGADNPQTSDPERVANKKAPRNV